MIDPPLILSLETAVMGGSVWLGRGSVQLASRNGNPLISQSNSLLSDINDCLEQAGLSLADVDVFACASGPGSFTGLRIGIATLKALAATLDRPCIGIPTLQAVAHAAGPSRATVSLLPAGRGEVFAQRFSVSDHDIVTAMDPAAHLSPEKLIERYADFADLHWAGSGAQLHREAIKKGALACGFVFTETSPATSVSTTPQGWSVVAKERNLAMHVAALAQQAYNEGALQRPDSLKAIYVRPSDAELKEQFG